MMLGALRTLVVWLVLALASILGSKLHLTRQVATSGERATTEHAQPDSPLTQSLKIAIAAFYAICIQRGFETAISRLNVLSPSLSFYGGIEFSNIAPATIVLVLQLVAYVIWVSLYYIVNIKLYLELPTAASSRRVSAHVHLTVTLGTFYMLGATIGHPSVNQVCLILMVVILDAVFPLFLSSVLPNRERAAWVVRGVIQTGFVMWILFRVRPERYHEVIWSLLLCALMIIQLVVGVPLQQWLNKQSSSRIRAS